MPLSFWCVLIAGILPVLAIIPVKATRRYDNADPRDYYTTLTGLRKRAYAAHLNSLEAFPFFAVAVLAAHSMGRNSAVLDILAAIFVVLRVGYIGAYWTGRPNLRSCVWLCAWFCCIAIFVMPVLA